MSSSYEFKIIAKINNICDRFVPSSLRFLSEFAEAPWIDGGPRILRRELDSLKVHAKYEE